MQQTQQTQQQPASAVSAFNAHMAESASALQTLAAVNQSATAKVVAQVAIDNQQAAQEYITNAQARHQAELTRRGVSYVQEKVPVDDKSKPVWDKDRPVLNEDGTPATDEKGEPIYEQAQDASGKLLFEPLRDRFGNIRYNTVTRITGVPSQEQWFASFFLDSVPCWFPGCEEKRAKYKAALEEAAKAAGKDHCAPCQEGAVMRSMRDEVMPLIIKAGPPYTHSISPVVPLPAASTNYGPITKTISGTATSPGFVAASQKPVGKKRSLLRKALDRIANYFGYSPNA